MFTAPFVWHYYARPLDVGVMHAAAQLLRSAAPRDMSAFRKKRASARHTMITVSDVQVRAVGGSGALVELEVTADWFVYGMMRLLAATLVRVGAGQLTVAEFGEIVENGLRDRVTFSAPANGLCLLQVTYPRDVDPFPLAKEAEGTEGVVHVATADVSNS